MKKLFIMLLMGALLIFILNGCAGSCGSDVANGDGNGSENTNDGKVEISGRFNFQDNILEGIPENERDNIITRSDIVSPIPIPSTYIPNTSSFKIKKYKNFSSPDDPASLAWLEKDDVAQAVELVDERGEFSINVDMEDKDVSSLYLVFPYENPADFFKKYSSLEDFQGYKIPITVDNETLFTAKSGINAVYFGNINVALENNEIKAIPDGKGVENFTTGMEDGLQLQLLFDEETGEPIVKCGEPPSSFDITDSFAQLLTNPSNALTLIFWLRSSSQQFTGYKQKLIFDKEGTFRIIHACNGPTSCYFKSYIFCGDKNEESLTTSSTFENVKLDEWIFLVAKIMLDPIKQIPIFRLYVDGILANQGTCPEGSEKKSSINITPEENGYLCSDPNDPGKGTMGGVYGEVSIYDRALSSFEIANRYNATKLEHTTY